MENMESTILTKCGWSEKQQGFLGMLVHNIKGTNDVPIADVVCRRDENQISVDWFVPNKQGDKISMTYDVKAQSLMADKTDEQIKSDKDVNAFLDTIENTVKGNKGMFFPSTKITSVTKKLHV